MILSKGMSVGENNYVYQIDSNNKTIRLRNLVGEGYLFEINVNLFNKADNKFKLYNIYAAIFEDGSISLSENKNSYSDSNIDVLLTYDINSTEFIFNISNSNGFKCVINYIPKVNIPKEVSN